MPNSGAPFRSYCAGLLLPGARKSVEPMAARVAPGRVQAAHQSLNHFVAKADSSDEALLAAAVRAQVLPVMQRAGPIRRMMVDDTGLPKKGSHSVGVARQNCGQLGKQDNCRGRRHAVAEQGDLCQPATHHRPAAGSWAEDAARRAKRCSRTTWVFQTKPQLALAQIRAAIAAGVPLAPVWPIPDMPSTPHCRDGITGLGLAYAVRRVTGAKPRAW